MLDKRALTLVLLAGACSERTAMQPPPPPPPPPGGVAIQQVPGEFSKPLFVTAPPGDLERIFVVEQTGRIRVVRNDAPLPQPFLDLSASVSTGEEQGLLGLAFHPQYATNGRFYVSYTNTAGDTRVVRYDVSSAPDVADPVSGDTVLLVAQPGQTYHNGGWIGFGLDGYLYVALGDGFFSENGQRLNTLLGKILRLDVDVASGYAIPQDNPFVGTGGALDEIWAYGLRNPWRASFDRQTGDLYIADVGELTWEEVDVQPVAGGGQNYGWSVMEGAHCYRGEPCDRAQKVLPIYEYDRTAPGQGCAIIGGYVYRGSRVPALAGRYVFADLCAGFVRSFRYVGGRVEDLRDHTESLAPPSTPSSFGEDARGELYLTSLEGGVYRFVAVAP